VRDKDAQLIWENYKSNPRDLTASLMKRFGVREHADLVAHVFRVLISKSFKPQEGNVWLLGDVNEAEDYAKITFTSRSDDQSSMDPMNKLIAAYGQDEIELGEEHIVAMFNTNAVVDSDPRQADRYDLTNQIQVTRLIQAIQEAWNEINRRN